ncbi:MAG: D-hexose-6-phosphate mutarotase [Pseudoxanthomonas sp.]
MTITEGELLGLPALLIRTPWADAAVSLHGGQVLSWVPKGMDEVFWLSPLSKRAPDAIRGGVPVCWPYFGREGEQAHVPQHGFARNTRWVLANCVRDGEGGITLELELPQRSPNLLRLVQSLHIGRVLRQSLRTHNDGPDVVHFTQALHSYFRVGDATRVQVRGLEGLAYADKFDGKTHVQSGEWSLQDVRDPGRSDRIYHDTGKHFELIDPSLGRRIELATSGSRSLVVWNPGASGIAAISDAPAESWRNFVCLEASNAGQDVIELPPGQTHTLQQTVSLHSLT